MKLCLVSVLLIFFIIDSNGIPTSPDNEIPVEGRKDATNRYQRPRCRGGDHCCFVIDHVFYNTCDEGEGDCDTDDDCKEGLKCGTNNCEFDGWGIIPHSTGWDIYDDCCYKP